MALCQHRCDGPKYTFGSDGSQETFLYACRMMRLAQLLRVHAAAFRMAELRSTGQIVCKVVSSQGWIKSDRSSRRFTYRPAYFCDYVGYWHYHDSATVTVVISITNADCLLLDISCLI
jgi:hypothetical protein